MRRSSVDVAASCASAPFSAGSPLQTQPIDRKRESRCADIGLEEERTGHKERMEGHAGFLRAHSRHGTLEEGANHVVVQPSDPPFEPGMRFAALRFFGRKSTLRPAHTRFQALARTLYDGRVGWRLKPCNDLVRQFRRTQIASGEAWRLIGRRTHQMSPSHCPCHPTG